MSHSFKLAIKYLNKTVEVLVDRPMHSNHPKFNFVYPVNYGYIKNETAPDGGGLDAYILGVSEPIKNFTGSCIALVHRKDDDDDKLIVVPIGDEMSWTKDKIKKEIDFQEKWFDAEVCIGEDLFER